MRISFSSEGINKWILVMKGDEQHDAVHIICHFFSASCIALRL